MTVVVTHSTPADGSFSTTGATAWNANHTLSGVGTMAGQDANSVAITGGSISGVSGVVTSVGGTGTVNGLSLSGTITSSGNLTFGGTLDLSSPPAIGSTAASTGAFTTLSASSTVSGAGFSTYLASPPAIGGTAAAAGTFTTLIGGSGSANYEQITGGATGKAVQFQSLGSDAAVSLAIQSKGTTGAIDLSAQGGVNISNGGTVTAITRTATGSAYTTIPSIALSAPTTAGGVQATASVGSMVNLGGTVQAGGTGYTNGDVLTVVGGTPTGVAATLTVTGVSGGAITTVSATNFGQYTVLPTNPVSVTGGTGSSATLNLTWGIGSAVGFNITNAGSGYVEQPTVTFSGGGGSGAAAYAVVGSQTIVKGLGTSTGTITNQSIMFQTPAGNSLLLRDSGQATSDAHFMVQATANGYALALAEGSNANASLYVGAKGTGSVRFVTNSTGLTEQMRVSATASAVNYVQVTGAVTGGAPTISAQGSDAAVGLLLTSKGTLPLYLNTAGAIDVRIQPLGIRSFSFNSVTSAVNYGTWINAIAGASPTLSVAGSDTDIDLTLTPKNAGNVRFGTYTASALLAVAGYITIKDSGGTTRRLLVG
jgi:hypothetical protein